MVDRLTLYLFAGCLVFGAIIFIELGPAAREGAALPELVVRANITPAAQREQNPRVEQLLETALARPVFSSTRRPEPSVADDSAADTGLSDKRLTGIVTKPGRHIAIFAVKDARPLILGEGETVSGWRIETIAPIEVSLSGPAGNKTLRPKPDPNLALPSGAPTAAALQRNPPIPPPTGVAVRPNPGVPPNIPGMPPPRAPRLRQGE
jgi:hypothetical protein